jgi:hypothetical protein
VGITTNIILYLSCPWISTGFFIKKSYSWFDKMPKRQLFIELERDVDKNLEQRQAKWRNFYQASGGMMFVVCDNRSCMRNVRSEINYCLVNRPLVVSLTNMADLQVGKRGEGDSVWLEARNRG